MSTNLRNSLNYALKLLNLINGECWLCRGLATYGNPFRVLRPTFRSDITGLGMVGLDGIIQDVMGYHFDVGAQRAVRG